MITIKKIIFVLRRIIYAFLLLFSLNISLKNFGISIPINEVNVALTSILGVPGLLCLFIVKLLMF